VERILKSRRFRTFTLDDVARLTVSVAKIRPFIVTSDWRPTLLTDKADLKRWIKPEKSQLELFAA
jgi:predicted DNA-binding helix-hairpin-helix protein